MSDDKYPEHAKMRKVADLSQSIGEFLDWLTSPSQGSRVIGMWRPTFCLSCKAGWIDFRRDDDKIVCQACGAAEFNKSEDRLLPAHDRLQDLLARYFGIDLAAIEKEKRAMLDRIRSLSTVAPPKERE